jgi:hypothetical protein
MTVQQLGYEGMEDSRCGLADLLLVAAGFGGAPLGTVVKTAGLPGLVSGCAVTVAGTGEPGSTEP